MTNVAPAENVCGLYDSESNIVYLDTGKVIRLHGKLSKTLPNQEMVFDKLNRWARYRGHTKEGEVIGVY